MRVGIEEALYTIARSGRASHRPQIAEEHARLASRNRGTIYIYTRMYVGPCSNRVCMRNRKMEYTRSMCECASKRFILHM